MIRVGLVGLGAMGRGHFEKYQRLMQEDRGIELVAICDIDPARMTNESVVSGNIEAMGDGKVDMTKFHQYTDYNEMLEKENLDVLDVVLPTYLHKEAAIAGFAKGCHVMCEKPMAMTTDECQAMIDASKAAGKLLMVGQCLRFWPMYQELKKAVENDIYGKCTAVYFFRGGATPKWSYQNWLLTKDKSGGALLDQHIHDVDLINWIFGTPASVSAIGKVRFPGSGYDAVTTNYYYEDGPIINAQDDWTMNGFGFEMIFRASFERGNVVLRANGTLEYMPEEGEKYAATLNPDDGYYHELVYFYDCVKNNKPVLACPPESTMETIRIAQAELASCDAKGQVVAL